MQKNRLSISREQRLFLLRELVSIRKSLEKTLKMEGISLEARIAVADELAMVSDLVRKLERTHEFVEGVNY